ncbi:MAG: hypothetical protein PHT32_01155, partial [Candidatus Omnitrophica bacterium]|nr:hypothetical protein [Candidatus Omnitrophota bacterium]
NTDVVNNITTVTHTDGSQSQIYFNPNPAKTDIWAAWYVEPNKRPKVTHKVTFTGQSILNADGTLTYYGPIGGGGYMNVRVSNRNVIDVYMMTVDFKDKFIWDSYTSGKLDITADAIARALADRKDLNGDNAFSIDSLNNKDTDLDIVNNIFDLTHHHATPNELSLMDIDGNNTFDDDDIEVYETEMSYLVDLDNDADHAATMYDLLELRKELNKNVSLRDTKFDINGDGAVNETDYTDYEHALNIINDINGDGKIDTADVNKMKDIVRYEKERRLIELSDLNGDHKIDSQDIAIINRVRMIDVNGDEIIRSFVNPDTKLDWSKLSTIAGELRSTHNEDWVETALMADLELTTDLFDLLDKNNDGIFNSLDLPEGIDPNRFHEYDVFREGDDEGVLSYYDEHLVERSIANLMFSDKIKSTENMNGDSVIDERDDELYVQKFDLNHDGILDFKDYEIYSRLYDILYPQAGSVSRDIDLSEGLPDTDDVKRLRYLAMLLTESDINGDGFRNDTDAQIIAAAMTSVSKRFDNSNVARQGLSVDTRATGTRVMKHDTDEEYTIDYNLDIGHGGYYNIGLSAKCLDGISIPEGGTYTFRISVLDPTTGQVINNVLGADTDLAVRGSSGSFIDGSIRLYIKDSYLNSTGKLKVRFTWTNAGTKDLDLDRDGVTYQGLGHIDTQERVSDTVEIKDAFAYTDNYDERCDLTGADGEPDGKVDELDLAEFRNAVTAYAEYRRSDINGDGRIDDKDRLAFENGLDVSNTMWNQIVTMGDTVYHISYNKDTDVYTINGIKTRSGSNVITLPIANALGAIVQKKFLIISDINGEVRLAEKLDGDINGAEGKPDGNIDIWDWSLMTSYVTTPPIRTYGADFMENESAGFVREGNYAVPGGTGAMMESTFSGGAAGLVYQFDIHKIYQDGYDFGLEMELPAGQALPPEGYEYKFDIYVDGRAVKAGTIVTRSLSDPTRSYLKLDKNLFGEGENVLGLHRIKVVCQQAYPVVIKQVYLRDADHRADINNDGFSDSADYEIFRRQFTTSRDVRSITLYEGSESRSAYVVRNGDGTYTVLVDRNGTIDRHDSDSDGRLVNLSTDLNVRNDYCIYVDPATNAIYLTKYMSGDVNFDGTVDWKDSVVYQRMFLDQSRPIAASDYIDKDESWAAYGTGMATGEMNKKITYRVDILEKGEYAVGLDIMNIGSQAANYADQIAIYVDGEYLGEAGSYSVNASTSDFVHAAKDIDLTEGSHTIAFEWRGQIPAGTTQLVIKDLEVFDKRLDIVNDGTLTDADIEAFRSQYISTSQLKGVTYTGTTYIIRANGNGTYTLFNPLTYTPIATSADDGILYITQAAEPKKLQVTTTTDGQIQVRELLVQDVDNKNGVTDADVQIIIDQLAYDNVRKDAEDFYDKSGTGFRYSNDGILFTGSADDYLEYRVTVGRNGLYNLGIEAFAQSVPAGYKAQLAITVGDETTYLQLDPETQYSSLKVSLAEGQNTVKIRWSNRDLVPQGASVDLKALSVTDERVNRLADINLDGIVDTNDVDAWYELAPHDARIYQVDLPENTYFAVKRYDGTYRFTATDSLTPPYDSSKDGKTVRILNTDYVIAFDQNSNRLRLSELKGSDVSRDGIINLSDEDIMKHAVQYNLAAAGEGSEITDYSVSETYRFGLPDFAIENGELVFKVKPLSTVSLPNYKYDIQVYVDGAYKGTAKIDLVPGADYTTVVMAIGSLGKTTKDGKHSVLLKWANKGEAGTAFGSVSDLISFGNIVVRDTSVNLACDLNHDEIVNSADILLWHELAPNELNSRRVMITKDDGVTTSDIYVRVNLDGTYSVFNDTGNVIVQATEKGKPYFTLGAKRYDISQNSLTGDLSVTEHVEVPRQAEENVKRIQVGTEIYSMYADPETGEITFVNDDFPAAQDGFGSTVLNSIDGAKAYYQFRTPGRPQDGENAYQYTLAGSKNTYYISRDASAHTYTVVFPPDPDRALVGYQSFTATFVADHPDDINSLYIVKSIETDSYLCEVDNDYESGTVIDLREKMYGEIEDGDHLVLLDDGRYVRYVVDNAEDETYTIETVSGDNGQIYTIADLSPEERARVLEGVPAHPYKRPMSTEDARFMTDSLFNHVNVVNMIHSYDVDPASVTTKRYEYTSTGNGKVVLLNGVEYLIKHTADGNDVVLTEHAVADVNYDGIIDRQDTINMDMNAGLDSQSFAINDTIDNTVTSLYTTTMNYSGGFNIDIEGRWEGGKFVPGKDFKIDIYEVTGTTETKLGTASVQMTPDGNVHVANFLKSDKTSLFALDKGVHTFKIVWTNAGEMRNNNQNLNFIVKDLAVRDKSVNLACDLNGDRAVTSEDMLIFEGMMPLEGHTQKVTVDYGGTVSHTLYMTKLRNGEFYVIEEGNDPSQAKITTGGHFSFDDNNFTIHSSQTPYSWDQNQYIITCDTTGIHGVYEPKETALKYFIVKGNIYTIAPVVGGYTIQALTGSETALDMGSNVVQVGSVRFEIVPQDMNLTGTTVLTLVEERGVNETYPGYYIDINGTVYKAEPSVDGYTFTKAVAGQEGPATLDAHNGVMLVNGTFENGRITYVYFDVTLDTQNRLVLNQKIASGVEQDTRLIIVGNSVYTTSGSDMASLVLTNVHDRSLVTPVSGMVHVGTKDYLVRFEGGVLRLVEEIKKWPSHQYEAGTTLMHIKDGFYTVRESTTYFVSKVSETGDDVTVSIDADTRPILVSGDDIYAIDKNESGRTALFEKPKDVTASGDLFVEIGGALYRYDAGLATRFTTVSGTPLYTISPAAESLPGAIILDLAEIAHPANVIKMQVVETAEEVYLRPYDKTSIPSDQKVIVLDYQSGTHVVSALYSTSAVLVSDPYVAGATRYEYSFTPLLGSQPAITIRKVNPPANAFASDWIPEFLTLAQGDQELVDHIQNTPFDEKVTTWAQYVQALTTGVPVNIVNKILDMMHGTTAEITANGEKIIYDIIRDDTTISLARKPARSSNLYNQEIQLTIGDRSYNYYIKTLNYAGHYAFINAATNEVEAVSTKILTSPDETDIVKLKEVEFEVRLDTVNGKGDLKLIEKPVSAIERLGSANTTVKQFNDYISDYTYSGGAQSSSVSMPLAMIGSAKYYVAVNAETGLYTLISQGSSYAYTEIAKNLSRQSLAGIVSNTEALWNELRNAQYIDENGVVTGTFTAIANADGMTLSGVFSTQKQEIYSYLKANPSTVAISKDGLGDILSGVDGLWAELKDQNYLDANGKVTSTFKALPNGTFMRLSEAYTARKADIYNLLAGTATNAAVTKQSLAGVCLYSVDSLWQELRAANYIDANGKVTSVFTSLAGAANMVLSSSFAGKKTAIYNLLNDAPRSAGVQKQSLGAVLMVGVDSLWSELRAAGYIDQNGLVTTAFKALADAGAMALSDGLSGKKQAIYDLMKNAPLNKVMTAQSFGPILAEDDCLWAALAQANYIDQKGTILNAFKTLSSADAMTVASGFASYKSEIYNYLQGILLREIAVNGVTYGIKVDGQGALQLFRNTVTIDHAAYSIGYDAFNGHYIALDTAGAIAISKGGVIRLNNYAYDIGVNQGQITLAERMVRLGTTDYRVRYNNDGTYALETAVVSDTADSAVTVARSYTTSSVTLDGKAYTLVTDEAGLFDVIPQDMTVGFINYRVSYAEGVYVFTNIDDGVSIVSANGLIKLNGLVYKLGLVNHALSLTEQLATLGNDRYRMRDNQNGTITISKMVFDTANPDGRESGSAVCTVLTQAMRDELNTVLGTLTAGSYTNASEFKAALVALGDVQASADLLQLIDAVPASEVMPVEEFIDHLLGTIHVDESDYFVMTLSDGRRALVNDTYELYAGETVITYKVSYDTAAKNYIFTNTLTNGSYTSSGTVLAMGDDTNGWVKYDIVVEGTLIRLVERTARLGSYNYRVMYKNNGYVFVNRVLNKAYPSQGVVTLGQTVALDNGMIAIAVQAPDGSVRLAERITSVNNKDYTLSYSGGVISLSRTEGEGTETVSSIGSIIKVDGSAYDIEYTNNMLGLSERRILVGRHEYKVMYKSNNAFDFIDVISGATYSGAIRSGAARDLFRNVLHAMSIADYQNGEDLKLALLERPEIAGLAGLAGDLKYIIQNTEATRIMTAAEYIDRVNGVVIVGDKRYVIAVQPNGTGNDILVTDLVARNVNFTENDGTVVSYEADYRADGTLVLTQQDAPYNEFVVVNGHAVIGNRLFTVSIKDHALKLAETALNIDQSLYTVDINPNGTYKFSTQKTYPITAQNTGTDGKTTVYINGVTYEVSSVAATDTITLLDRAFVFQGTHYRVTRNAAGTITITNVENPKLEYGVYNGTIRIGTRLYSVDTQAGGLLITEKHYNVNNTDVTVTYNQDGTITVNGGAAPYIGSFAKDLIAIDRNGDAVPDCIQEAIYGPGILPDMGGNLLYDSDGDSIPDIVEVLLNGNLGKTTINDADDGDGVPDALEIKIYGTIDNTMNNNYLLDNDSDGMPDVAETLLFRNLTTHTLSLSKDTDADGVNDALEEHLYGVGNLSIDMSQGGYLTDNDHDATPDIVEHISLSPEIADNDGDGMPDNIEVMMYGSASAPHDLSADSDTDGLADIVEYTLFGNLSTFDRTSSVNYYPDKDGDIKIGETVYDIYMDANGVKDFVEKYVALGSTDYRVDIAPNGQVTLTDIAYPSLVYTSKDGYILIAGFRYTVDYQPTDHRVVLSDASEITLAGPDNVYRVRYERGNEYTFINAAGVPYTSVNGVVKINNIEYTVLTSPDGGVSLVTTNIVFDNIPYTVIDNHDGTYHLEDDRSNVYPVMNGITVIDGRVYHAVITDNILALDERSITVGADSYRSWHNPVTNTYVFGNILTPTTTFESNQGGNVTIDGKLYRIVVNPDQSVDLQEEKISLLGHTFTLDFNVPGYIVLTSEQDASSYRVIPGAVNMIKGRFFLVMKNPDGSITCNEQIITVPGRNLRVVRQVETDGKISF